VTDAPSGFLLIDKPAGLTSHDAVDSVRRATGVRKVGHAGTLDPAATGLLLVAVGRATRLLRYAGELSKEYEGTGLLGVETDTLDADGAVVGGDADAASRVTEGDLRAAMAAFVGEIEQIPPAYSAVKVGGERLYRAARRGEAVAAPPRTVRVDAFDLVRFEPPAFDVRVVCSGGTYVRTLAADIGTRLGCGAHLIRLRRVAIGPLSVTTARPPDAPGDPIPADEVLAHLASVEITDEEAVAVSHGRVLGPSGVAGPYRVHGPDGTLLGIYHDEGPKAVPDVVLAPAG